MPEKGQTMRFTNAELGLIKALFADNTGLLYTIRKSLLGFTLSEEEQKTLRSLSKESIAVIRKTFLPQLDPNAPLFQLSDMVLGLNVDMKGQTEENSLPLIEAKSIEVKYMEEALDILEGSDIRHELNLEDLARFDSPNPFVHITARNYLLNYIDSNCKQLEFLAGTKEESVEETVERLKKNSNK